MRRTDARALGVPDGDRDRVAAALHERIHKSESGCWLWIGRVDPFTGYGLIKMRPVFGDNMIRAHRLSYALHIAALADLELVLHKCDVRNCIAPDHLFLGDHAANTADMMAKGRHGVPRGEASFRAKLKRHAVEAILKDDRQTPIVAAEHGVSEGTISAIRRGKSWRHLGGNRGNRGKASGENNSQARATEAMVRAIRADDRTLSAIAKTHGLSIAGVHRIKQRVTWKHVQ